MKKLFFLVLIGIFMKQISLNSQPTDYVGYWKLNGNADDESTNNYNGTIYGAVGTIDKDDNANGALLFDGNDYITTSLNLSGFNTVTFSTWINASAINSSQKIISQESNTAGIERDIYLGILQVSGANKLYFYIRNGSNYKYIYTGHVIDLNTWYHIVGTWSSVSGEMKIFLNSEEQSVTESSSGTVTVIGNNSNSNIKFGCEYVGSAYFNGSIDEIRIYDRELSMLEISELFEGTISENSIWQENTENIYYEGKVSIGGTSVPTGFDFSVNGKIVTKEVKVTIDPGIWSDFVFKPDYKLMPISQLENYIIQNNHLPSIPPEKNIIESGVSLGEMNAKLLQKIEELTLYTIEQQKQIDKQMELIEILEKKIEQLQK